MGCQMALSLGLAACLVPVACATARAGKRQGVTLYVSKLGDNSDGASWAKAFHSVQAALDAVPDARGGHRIVVRPDTYMEANLWPAHSGAEGAYNELIGDVDGALGAGVGGWVVLDSGAAGGGFKSYDWWSTIRATTKGWSGEHTEETFSAIVWDRWRLRHLYATGGDAGLMWDCTNQVKPFTVVVEDCVGIGRAFGGGVASCLSRYDEPITFRRCHLWALDWWGDTAAAYVRVENEEMPDRADVVFEDCTLTSPQCALKGGNFGFKTSMRVRVVGCRLVALNFSQPHGTPIDGIIQSVEHGKYLHVDLEDCTLRGYKVFGVRVNKDTVDELGYTTRGSVRAYVQYRQDVPPGITRLGHWPVDTFQALLPPAPEDTRPVSADTQLVRRGMCEVTPVVWRDRLCLFECVRPPSGGTVEDYYLKLTDVETDEEIARFGTGHSLACAFAQDDVLYVFASRFEAGTWNDVTVFRSRDLAHWEQRIVIEQDPAEHLFNSSVCRGPDGYVMAYETNDPAYPAFTIKLARSSNLLEWERLPGAVFGTDRYTACPCIRYSGGQYYLLYLERRSPRWFFETYIARSPDLGTWDLSSANPVLTPHGDDEGINASDPDLVEWEGQTYVYYCVGDQRTWADVKRRQYAQPLGAFLRSWFTER